MFYRRIILIHTPTGTIQYRWTTNYFNITAYIASNGITIRQENTRRDIFGVQYMIYAAYVTTTYIPRYVSRHFGRDFSCGVVDRSTRYTTPCRPCNEPIWRKPILFRTPLVQLVFLTRAYSITI